MMKTKLNTVQKEPENSTQGGGGDTADTGTGTGTGTDSSSLPDKEPDKIRCTTSGTSQEQNQEIIAGTSSNTRTDTNSSNEIQEIIEEGAQFGAPLRSISSKSSGSSSSSSSSSSGSSSTVTVKEPRNNAPLPPSIKPIQTIPQMNGIIHAMAIGSDGSLFTGSHRMVCKWRKGILISSFESPKGTVNAIVLKYRWLLHEPWVFLAHDTGEIGFWVSRERDGLFAQHRTLKTFRAIFPWIESCHDAISCLCLSDDCNFIYAGSAAGVLNVWSADRFKLVCMVYGHKSTINALAVGLGAVFSGSSDGTVKLWKRKGERNKKGEVKHSLIRTFYAQNGTVPAAVNTVFFSSINNVTGFLYAGSSDGNVRCWKNINLSVHESNSNDHNSDEDKDNSDEDKADENRANKHKPEIMGFHTGAVNCLASCSSGPFIFSGSRDKTICVWRRAEGETAKHTVAMVLRGHTDVVKCIAVQNEWEVDNAAGSRQWILYSGSLDKTLRIWLVFEHPQAL